MAASHVVRKDEAMEYKAGAAVKELRSTKGLSQAALGKRIGVTQQSVGDIEKRQHLHCELVVEIEKALELEPGTIFLRAGYVTNTPPARQAIETDPLLDDNQRRTVLAVYDGFAHRDN